jgi:outer membrane lipoprotein-sorting protein
MAELKKHFSVSLTETGTNQDYSLKLTLKIPEKEIQTVKLTVKRQDFQIKELTIYYGSGNYTQLALIDIKENPGISEEHFQFLPPPGAEIVENPAPITHP